MFWRLIALLMVYQVLKDFSLTGCEGSTHKDKKLFSKSLENVTELNATLSNTTLTNGTEAPVEKPRPPAPIYPDCMYVTNTSLNLMSIYSIQTGKLAPFNAYCDMPIRDYFDDEDMWTIVLRRSEFNVDFNRSFFEYAWGFGDINSDFFIGLFKLHALTSRRGCELLINMTDVNGLETYARYQYFGIEGLSNDFRVWSLGGYNGTAGDAMRASKFRKFSAYDRDNDNVSETHCGKDFGAGWWFRDCDVFLTLPTGLNPKINYTIGGVRWGVTPDSELRLSFVQIAVRPVMPRKGRKLSRNVQKNMSEFRKFRRRGNNNYLLPDNPEMTIVEVTTPKPTTTTTLKSFPNKGRGRK